MNAIHPTMAVALRGFMPPAKIITAGAHKTPNVLVDPIELKGLYEHEYTHTNLVLNCFLDYEEGFDGGTGPESDESYPERITLSYALANGVDVMCLLDEDTVSEIEAEALAAMSISAFDADYDRGADRYEDRWAA
ncbi:MAG: hypothetical protein KBD82_11105 [Rhodoferax sp.]|uniref:hypothetical protein n=1 Tax=Rhodoferax sp. TaxID=50421 RepID=UPI001B6DAE00|nr:hypothetical protein [Rhodoferax sp.]MBP9736171.1 hypothetical protein [Rhodoferax sp.]